MNPNPPARHVSAANNPPDAPGVHIDAAERRNSEKGVSDETYCY